MLKCKTCILIVQENYRKDMSLKDAEVMALSTLKEVMEEKVISRHIWHSVVVELAAGKTDTESEQLFLLIL